MASKKTKTIVDEAIIDEPVVEEAVAESPIVENIETIQEEPKVKETPEYLIVTAVRLNIRKGPSKDTEILTIVSKGDKLVKNTKKLSNGFYSVTTDNNIQGYVMKEFVVEK